MTEALLDGPSRPAASGTTRQLIVLLHGLGADGNDLIGLAEPLAEDLPDTAFVAPDAPFACDMAPVGRQWFSLQEATPTALLAGARAAAGALDGFLDAQLQAHSMGDGSLAMIGFSQGGMMALHVGLRRAVPCASICGFSTLLVGAETLAEEIRARPPVLLVHGEMDPVVPFAAMGAAAEALAANEVPVAVLARPGLAHGIDPPGLGACLKHLGKAFGIEIPTA